MAHQLLIGKGMITLNLKRIFLTLTLLPLFAVAADDCAFVSVCAGRDAGDGDAERLFPRYAIPVERDFALVDVCDADFLSGYDLAGGASGDFPFEPDVSAD